MLTPPLIRHPLPPILANEAFGGTRALLFAPALVLALVAIPFRYEVTLAEPDLVRMMAALIYGEVSGLKEAAGMHYGLPFSFGYYQLLYALAPQEWLRDPDLAATLINLVGVVSGLLCAWSCTFYLNKLFGTEVAVVAALMFFLSPMMLPLAFSGHPMVAGAACLFAGGWALLKADEDGRSPWQALSYYVIGSLLVIAALTIRAEVVLGFPFLWLAGAGRSRPTARLGRRALLCDGLVLGMAFVVFLVLQHQYVAAEGGAATRVSAFLEKFLSVSSMGRGVAVLGLAAGTGTLVAAAVAAWRLGWRGRDLWLPAVLAVPALVLWLPNPQPARHFFFVVMAACLLTSLWLRKAKFSFARLMALSLGIALTNQVIAEATRPLIVTRYDWSYPLMTDRRATQQVPLGFFPLDQRANQTVAAIERQEAMDLATRLPPRLVILADFQHYLVAHFLVRDPRLEWSEFAHQGILFTKLRSPERTIVMAQKYDVWPRDAGAEILAAEAWQRWPVYVQQSTLSRFDKARVPTERQLHLK